MSRAPTLALAAALLLAACGDTTLSERLQPWGAATTMDVGVVFLTQPDAGGVRMDALYRGPLVVRGRCVLIGSPGDYSVPIWPKGFTAARDGSGSIVVRDGNGADIVTDGRTFEMGGGYAVEFRPEDKVEPRKVQLEWLEEFIGYRIPRRCLGPEIYGIWIVGDT